MWPLWGGTIITTDLLSWDIFNQLVPSTTENVYEGNIFNLGKINLLLIEES